MKTLRSYLDSIFQLCCFIYRNIDCTNNDEIFEIDQTNWSDFMYMGCYARDIFKYLRQREVSYYFIIFLLIVPYNIYLFKFFIG